MPPRIFWRGFVDLFLGRTRIAIAAKSTEKFCRLMLVKRHEQEAHASEGTMDKYLKKVITIEHLEKTIMAILKLNKIYKFIILFLISCGQSASFSYSKTDCEVYVSAKQGFWLNINETGIIQNEISIQSGSKKIVPQKITIKDNNLDFLINEPIKVSDTLKIIYKGKSYLLYDFNNKTEIAIDASNHETSNICRVSTAKINGVEIDDSNNNVLKIYLK